MITLYTSVGRYELRKNENGEKQPIVKVDQKEMALSREELLLWSCLMWEILTKEEAKTYFLKKAVRMDVSQERFDAVLQRLEVRQLVVSAQAEKGDIALYRLLANLYVIPLESSFMVKVQAFFRFIFFEKLPLTVAKNVFQKENYTEMERRVLHLARKARLSCAEILACIANDEIDTSIGNQSELQKEKARDNLGFFLWFCAAGVALPPWLYCFFCFCFFSYPAAWFQGLPSKCCYCDINCFIITNPRPTDKLFSKNPASKLHQAPAQFFAPVLAFFP